MREPDRDEAMGPPAETTPSASGTETGPLQPDETGGAAPKAAAAGRRRTSKATKSVTREKAPAKLMEASPANVTRAAKPRKRRGSGETASGASAETAVPPTGTAPEEPGAGSPPALSVARLSFSYGTRKVLDEVTFRIEPGQFTALLGPNGAGKTTLFSLVTRLFDSGDGSIRIMGRDPKEHGAAALAPLGVVFQSETLDLDLTVRQNLHYFAALHGLRARAADERMREELDAVAMSEKIDVRVRELNGGHRRRVEIARALLHRPDLLLLDEATVGLDVPSRKAIVARVHALARERRIGVLWTTHLIDEVEPDDALIVLHKGRIIASGPTSDVVARTGRPSLAEAFDQLTRTSVGPEEGSR